MRPIDRSGSSIHTWRRMRLSQVAQWRTAVACATAASMETTAARQPVVAASPDLEERWARMDERSRQLDAQWPVGVSAVEALADVRRGGELGNHPHSVANSSRR